LGGHRLEGALGPDPTFCQAMLSCAGMRLFLCSGNVFLRAIVDT
jgi:hypothetical protein